MTGDVIHVIHTVASLGKSAGGPSRTVPALCAAVAHAGQGISVEIVTGENPAYGANVEVADVPTYTAAASAGAAGQRVLLMARIEHAMRANQHVLLHDHGQWLALNRASAAFSRRFGVKRIVTPRGMLTPWAMNHHAWKKRLAWMAYARRDLLGATALHATSQQEAEELRALGARQPIAVIPNGVEPYQVLRSESQKTRTVVFLSRLHPKKGVRELVEAWRAVQPAGWRLILAGPDEGGMLPQLHITANDSIEYVGELEGDVKWQLLELAGVVVLPSYSENFGMVVAEALMAGTPVIATHGTPWEGLIRERCGWWIPMSAESLMQALREACALDDQELMAMGCRGKDWVAKSFTWGSIGKSMAEVYRWMAGVGTAPRRLESRR